MLLTDDQVEITTIQKCIKIVYKCRTNTMGEQVEVLCLSSSTLKAFFYGFIVACAKKEALTEVDYVSKGFMSNQRIELFKKLLCHLP